MGLMADGALQTTHRRTRELNLRGRHIGSYVENKDCPTGSPTREWIGLCGLTTNSVIPGHATRIIPLKQLPSSTCTENG